MFSRQPWKIVLALCCLSRVAWGQDFVLENPSDPAAASTAAIVGTDLVITDAESRSFVYVRRPDLDAPDGSFQAFFCKEARQYLRWPVSGAGIMQIGTAVGGLVTWSPSRMQIRGGAGGPVAPPTFVLGGPLNTGTLPLGPDRICAAHIDSSGQLQCYIGHRDRWRHLAGQHPPGSLVPGAPIRLVAAPDSLVPQVITISTQGKFISISAGRIVEELPAPAGIKFPPGGNFEYVQTPTENHLYATERHGRLWRLDPKGGPHQIIEGHLGVLEPGLPITISGAGRELLMTDRHGGIVVYSVDAMGSWHGPELLADGFNSAGHVAAWHHPGTTDTEVAAVDRDGKLQIVRQTAGGWKKETPGGIALLPGSPLTAFETKSGLSLTAVLADGRWIELFEDGSGWHDRVIAAGFPPYAPLEFSHFGPMLFASDVTGRLVSAYWTGTEWFSVVCTPADFAGGQFGFAPRLISRKFIANRRIDPVIVDLQNTTPEELVVRVRDARIPGKFEEINLAPRSTSQFTADRDMGGTLEEVYLVPGPGGPVQQVRQLPLPPKQFYDMVVYAKRVTYQYIDRRKNKGPLPNFSESSLVSLGAFPLPPGALLPARTRLDVYQIATTSRNPGAAAVLDP